MSSGVLPFGIPYKAWGMGKCFKLNLKYGGLGMYGD